MADHATAADIIQLQELQDKVHQNPQITANLIRLGAMLFEPFHRPQEAVSYLNKAIEIDSKNDDAYFWLAKCYFHELMDLPAAREALEKALSINPDRADCHSLLASVLADLGHTTDECLVHTRQAVELAPDWFTPRLQLALTLLKMKRFDEAEIAVKEGLSLFRQVVTLDDPVKEYYEEAVTGRGRETALAELNELLNTIGKAKTKKSLLGRFLP